MLFQPYWNQWCGDSQTLLLGLRDALGNQQQQQPLIVTFERWFLLLKVGRPAFAAVLSARA